ncbi:MAG: hypothetical protein H0U81_10350 [Pyrinomonadaceae bacterium]|nr:hypothetical protein [Pyrinomonadaceae bacterium]
MAGGLFRHQVLFVAILLNLTVRVAPGKGVTWKGHKLYKQVKVSPPRGKVITSVPTLTDD